ncbi:response regulator [Pseudanabaena sp. ABRG5-3]|uniref:response regulator n=1 Tax=Pseudanabaena sp. ABRG5-3 TaxID=685565 RepID=UPI000DC6E2EE|nr:response regulator [Pseudanabaena sp. ABRG5-3]BBC24408.1 two-component response regulator [Pseudanabaena sp. ABRG5-3]
MKNTSSKTIVLIDDEEYICQIVQTCVEVFSDWKVIAARSGKEGLAAIATAQPDAILLDILMPNMDGFAVLKRLKASTTLVDIPIVLLTARADLAEAHKIAELGVQGIIVKPFHPTQITSEISQILSWV